MELTFTIFAKPAKLVEPAKQALDHPTTRQDDKFMQFIAFNDLDIGTAQLFNGTRKALTGVAAIDQKLFNA